MEEKKEVIIAHYRQHIEEIEELIDKVDNDIFILNLNVILILLNLYF